MPFRLKRLINCFSPPVRAMGGKWKSWTMLAARALGLDCGPMSGYDAAALDADFFAVTRVQSNFLCALGHGKDTPFDRLPRLPFEEACSLL